MPKCRACHANRSSLIIIQNYIISSLTNTKKTSKCQTNLKDLAISNISQQSILVEMQLPISGLIYSDIGLGRCTSPEYLTFQRQPKIWSDFYENCAKTSLQLGQLEMLNIPGNAQMKMIEDHNTTKAIAMQENTHLIYVLKSKIVICDRNSLYHHAPQEINIFVLLFHSVLTESSL